MLCAASDRSRLGGTLNQALTQGVLLGAKFVEIYQQDADRPSNQTMLAIQGAALKGNLGNNWADTQQTEIEATGLASTSE